MPVVPQVLVSLLTAPLLISCSWSTQGKTLLAKTLAKILDVPFSVSLRPFDPRLYFYARCAPGQ